MNATPSAEPRRHGRLVLGLVGMTIGMFAFGFALVPLYNVVCRITGLNGKGIEVTSAAYGGTVDENRTITVQFVATVNSHLPFAFQPDAGTMKVHPGELYATSFFAQNDSSSGVTAQAIATYAPGEAAKYVHKTECFCFTQETFGPREARHMPVRFYIDPALPRDVSVVTISYTYFNITPGENTGA